METRISVLALRFIARREDFQNAVTDHNARLKCIAVYANGEIVTTVLTSNIVSTRQNEYRSDVFHVTTEGGKREIEIWIQ